MQKWFMEALLSTLIKRGVVWDIRKVNAPVPLDGDKVMNVTIEHMQIKFSKEDE